jgi:hypothetical protein
VFDKVKAAVELKASREKVIEMALKDDLSWDPQKIADCFASTVKNFIEKIPL